MVKGGMTQARDASTAIIECVIGANDLLFIARGTRSVKKRREVNCNKQRKIPQLFMKGASKA